jgi:hypothetical protein
VVAIQRLFMPGFCVVAIKKAVAWPPGDDFEKFESVASAFTPPYLG